MTQKELLEKIKQAFDGISREGGVSLHETAVMDNYGSEDERAAAKGMDTDTCWEEVKDEWIEGFHTGTSGGLNFLDKKSFLYYMPAYMSWYLHKGFNSDFPAKEEVESYFLEANFDLTILNNDQAQVLKHFIQYISDLFLEVT